MKKYVAILALLAAATVAQASANETPISGSVSSKCSIFTNTSGVYAQPNPYTLSTDSADGGVDPVIRIDVSVADYYLANISYPTSFSQSPTLTDSITFTGDVTLGDVSDTGMAGYDNNKTTFNNTHQYDLTVAGTTYFIISSEATYGDNKSLPAGNYTAVVQSECIAK